MLSQSVEKSAKNPPKSYKLKGYKSQLHFSVTFSLITFSQINGFKISIPNSVFLNIDMKFLKKNFFAFISTFC
jgi:hypothetical protein